MICPKCGKPVQDGDKFCENCGMKIETSKPAPKQVVQTSPMPKKKPPMTRDKKIIIALVAAVVVVGGIVGGIAFGSGESSAYSKKLDTAQQYAAEGNYDAAIIEYNEAIKIEPKKDKAYIRLSKIYWDRGEKRKAQEVLEKGRTETGHEKTFDKELDQIGVAENDEDEYVADGDIFKYYYWEVNEINNEYADVCSRYSLAETGATDSYKVFSEKEGMFQFVFIGSGDNPDPNYDWDGIVVDTDKCQRMSGKAEYMFNLTENMTIEDMYDNYYDYFLEAPGYGRGSDLETSSFTGQVALIEIEDEQFIMLLRDVENLGTVTPDTMVDMIPFNGDYETLHYE